MTMPAIDSAHPTSLGPVPPFDATGFERSLSQRVTGRDEFEAVVREAVEAIGGVVLFHIRLDGGEELRQIAAVSIGGDVVRDIVIIDLQGDGPQIAISQARDSTLPIAAIAPAYAGLAACWSRAS